MKKIVLKILGLIVCVMMFAPSVKAQTEIDLSEFAPEFVGEAANDSAGASVSQAGDINNDGYDDILIGAHVNDDAGDAAGAAYLIYGQADALSSASLSTAVEFTGEADNDMAGFSVSGAGDVNGDGYDDFLIGAYGNDDAGGGAGAAYLIYGQADTLSSTSLSTAIEFTGEAEGDNAGYSVSGAGDVNYDGYDDMLIGAYRNDDGANIAGAAYLIYGQADALSSTSLSTAIEFTGEAAGDRAGVSVSGAGDINGDWYDDFLIGAFYNDNAGTNAGAAYLVYGQANALSSASLSTAVEFTGEAENDLAGISVSGAGDINYDGYNDFLIGAYGNDDAGSGAGAAYLIYGQAGALSSASLSTAVEFTGEADNDMAGLSVSGAGDVNYDGYDDFLISAFGNDDGGVEAGAAYLIYGQAGALSSASLSTAVEFTGEADYDLAGIYVSQAGDVNNDSFPDVLVGAYANDDGNTDAGAAYLGYLYMDIDGDLVPGTSGLISGTDCNDSDSTVYADQTYYEDADGDGYGNSDSTILVCSSTAPAGYVTNNADANDNDFDNDGSETGTDCNDSEPTIYVVRTYYADNDGDTLGSDESASLCVLDVPNGYADNANDPDDAVKQHPGYYNYDPQDSSLTDTAIASVSGDVNGNIKVTYIDSSEYTFNVFSITTDKTVKVEQYRQKGYYLVLHSQGKKIAIVNIYTGLVAETRIISTRKSYSSNALKIFKLRNKYWAVAVSKKKSQVRIHASIIKIDIPSFGKSAQKKITQKNIVPQRTAKKNNIIRLKNSNNKTERSLLMKFIKSSKKYRLQ